MAALVGRDAELCLQTPVTNLEIDGGVVHAVGIDTGTSEGAIPCDAVVLAGGADTPALAELANVKEYCVAPLAKRARAAHQLSPVC